MSHSMSGMHWYPNKMHFFSVHQYIYLKIDPPPYVAPTLLPPPLSCQNSAARSRYFDGTSQQRHTHLQQPTDWNINATHTDTTMSTLPTQRLQQQRLTLTTTMMTVERHDL